MKQLLKANQFEGALNELADEIIAKQGEQNNAAFVGIHTRGVPMAQRLGRIFKERKFTVPVGMLDINLYRDDLSEAASKPVLKATRIDFDINGKVIYLVDDVLFTGRTVRAAMDALFDLGRPKAVHLVVMAKRDGRELPIDTDFAALDVRTQPSDNIKVHFAETDERDEVVLLEKGEY